MRRMHFVPDDRIPVPVPSPLGQTRRLGFGCDICNDVCPWNRRFAESSEIAEYQDRGAIDTGDPAFFEDMSESQFAERFGDTPLERPGLSGMRRNWAAAARSLEPR